MKEGNEKKQRLKVIRSNARLCRRERLDTSAYVSRLPSGKLCE